MNTNTNNDYWLGAAGCNAADLDDKWHYFIATATSTTITYNSGSDAILHLFEGAACSNTMTHVACADATVSGDETIVYATTIGQTYHIRVQRYNSDTQMNGTICVYSAVPACPTPGNDETCSPTNMTPGGACLTGETNCGATSVWYGGCVPIGSPEVWYTTTLTGGNNTLDIDLTNTTFPGSNVNIMINTKDDACPADASMSNFGTYCGSDVGTISFPGLTAGVLYHIGISTDSGTDGSFDICLNESFTASFPDDPCDAVFIADDYCSAGLSHTNVGAVTSFSNGYFNANSCGDNQQNEVWFKFVATTNSLDIVLTQGTIGGPVGEVTIFQTTPDPNDCNDAYSVVDFSCGAWGSTLSMVNSLTAGETYYIAVDHQGGNGNEGTFDICLTSYNYTAPTGSGFTCATAIDINANGMPFQDISTTTGAGNNWDESCDYFYAADLGLGTGAADLIWPGWNTEDKFYSLTVPAGGGYYEYSLAMLNGSLNQNFPTVSIVNSCPAFADNDWAHNSGLCVGQTDKDGTDDQNSWASDLGLFDDLSCRGIYLPAGSYYIVIDNAAIICPDGGGCAYYDNQDYDYQFDFNTLSQAANNECGGAIGLFDGVTQNGNNAGCNYSYGANDPFSSEFCAFSTENLAWFTFTTGPAQTSVTLDFTNISGSIQWGVFSGACGGPYTSAGANASNTGQGFSSAGDPCDATSGPTYNTTVTGLTANTQYWFGVDGNAGTPSTFDVTITGITTLPVELTSFKGTNKNSHVLLEWVTATEINNDYFIVERSFDGIEYMPIGKIQGAGNSSTQLKYSLRDFDVSQKGVRYYRLKQVDFNGTINYHEVISVNISKLRDVNIFPNPVQSDLTVAFTALSDNAKTHVVIFDALGAVVFDQEFEADKGANNYTIQTDNFAEGIYYIMVNNEGSVTKTKFSKE